MTTQDNNIGKVKTDSLSDSAIRRSLLGCAEPAEQAKFEALLMLDDEFERRVHRLELELADDFSFGELSKEEQELFSTRFLVTPDRRRGLAVSEALRKAISLERAGRARTASQPSRLRVLSLFAFNRPWASAALAGVALLIFGTLAWLSLKAPPVRQLVVNNKLKPTPNPERQYAHPVASQSPASDRGTANEQPIVTLQPEGRSQSKQTVQIPNAAGAGVRLELLLSVAPTSGIPYEAKLMSADGVEVASFSELKAQPDGQSQVVLDIPARLLKTGSYFVELKQSAASGRDEFERYSFEVRQE